jgi:FkbM family methyltransferase
MGTTLAASLLKEILINLPNQYTDNYDPYRFGEKKNSFTQKVRDRIKAYLETRGFHQWNYRRVEKIVKALNPLLERLETTYGLLQDEKSKELLARLLAYRILGEAKVKLPLNTAHYWSKIDELKKLADGGETINSHGWGLQKMSLRKEGYPVELYLNVGGINNTFILEQYKYRTPDISAESGDIVIDAGACWGDTALYFAHKVGKSGRVFSFEFIPSNLEILKKNIQLNPDLEGIIEIVPQPLWNVPGLELYFQDRGPASYVRMEPLPNATGKTTTTTIDEVVKKHNLPRIDFIKMDIEGAEYNSLSGAIESIKKYRPKLAISVYHSLEDFARIPELIHSWNLGYKFHLEHFTIHKEETVLFCKA